MRFHHRRRQDLDYAERLVSSGLPGDGTGVLLLTWSVGGGQGRLARNFTSSCGGVRLHVRNHVKSDGVRVITSETGCTHDVYAS